MKLYHGTSEKAARLALKEGLKPRKLTLCERKATQQPPV